MATRPKPLTYFLLMLVPATIVAIVAVVLLRSPLGAAIPQIGGVTVSAATTPVPPAPAKTANDAIIANRDTVRVSAKLMPVKRAWLSLPTGGQVIEVIAKEGDQIKAGQPLLRLESAHQQLAVDQATLAVNQANATARQANAGYLASFSAMQRAALDLKVAITSTQIVVTSFVEMKANAALGDLNGVLDEIDVQSSQLMTVTNLPLKSAQAQVLAARATAIQAAMTVQAAKNGLQQAELVLKDRELLAPFDGTAAQINVKVGDFIGVGAPLIAFADFNQWRLETDDLTERELGKIATGQDLKFTLDAYPDVTYTGKVTDIRSMGQPRAGDVLFTAYLELGNRKPEWRWNMAATVLLNNVTKK